MSKGGWEDEKNDPAYLSMMMKSDKTDPQHRSKSSIIITTGLLQLPCSLYHVAKMDTSAACKTLAWQTSTGNELIYFTCTRNIKVWLLTSKVIIKNCLNILLRQPPIPFFTENSSEERLATWHPWDFKYDPSSSKVSKSSTNSIFSDIHCQSMVLEFKKKQNTINCVFYK